MGGTLSSWLGCCGDCDGEGSLKFAPSSKRSCTDILWLFLYIVSWAGMIAVIVEARKLGGDADRITHGVDYNGNTCGGSTPYSVWMAIPNPFSLTDPLEVSKCPGCYKRKACISDCMPETIRMSRDVAKDDYLKYDGDSVLYLCLPSPDKFKAFDDDFNSASEMASRAFADLWVTWPIILISAGVALAWAFAYEWLAKRWAGVLVWTAFLIMITGGFLMSYTLLKKAADINDTAAADRKKAMQGFGILMVILTFIFMLIVIALRKRIYIAVEVIKSASAAVLDMSSIVFFPLIPMFVGCCYFVFFGAITILLCSAWKESNGVWAPLIIAKVGAQRTDLGDSTPITANLPYDYSFNQDLRNSFAFVFFHLLWTVQFLIYYCYMVIAGATANWYFTPRDASGSKVRGRSEGELSPSPVLDSAFRTLRFHMGTLALGSLIIAAIEFIRAVVHYIERQTIAANGGKQNRLQKCLFCFIHCFLYCIQCCMDKISKNAFIWTAIWGESYAPAACNSFRLIWSNLGRVAALSIVSSYIVFIGKLFVAFVTTGIAGVAMFRYYGKELNSPVLPMITVFILAYMIASLFMSVVETVIDTVFICFLVDEKYNKASGKMLADPGLLEVINAHSDYCNEHAQKEKMAMSARPGKDGKENMSAVP